MPICPACKHEIAVRGRFCPECGAPLLTPPQPGPSAERETIPTAEVRTPSPESSSVHGRFEPGARLGHRYRVVGLLGRGGMGVVYRADDLELGQSVALKFLPEKVAQNAADLARLRSEVRTARQIAHPNVCRTYDIAESDGHVFVVMEYIDGEDLASVLRRLGRPSSDKALEIARQLCLGLGAAHENGVLHRDLKPANVMIDGRGRVRITDFGLAGTAEEIAAEGSVAGTPAYMAPEQQGSGAASAQSDIYALGLVLYEVFTGKRAADMMPRPDPSRPGSDSSVRTPSSLVTDIDPAVERVILRCLERDPARRPQSAYAVFGALPGGDPLAAAVAAGETPSPELVANAGIEGSVRPLFAGLAVAGVLIGLIIFSILQRPLLSGIERSPQVLSVRAEEVLTRSTGKSPPRFSSQGFRLAPAADSSTRAIARASPAKATPSGKPKLKPAPAKQYWRRWSPAPLVTAEVHTAGSTIDDPPQAFPGSGTVLLDTRGNLLSLVIAPDAAHDSISAGSVDWGSAIRASGRDPSQVIATAPPVAIASQADTVAAWRVSGSAGAETTLVAGALRGKIIEVDTYAAGAALGNLATRAPASRSNPLDWFLLTVFVLLPILGGSILAIRNLKSGRGDLRGALVVGVSIVALYLLEYLFEVNLGELGLFRVMSALTTEAPFAHALLHGVVMVIFYLAIEPYIRRLWPSVLVGWARLVVGRVRDPIVGRDILVGALLGIAFAALGVAHEALARRFGLVDVQASASLQTLQATISAQAILSMTMLWLAISIVRATTFFTLLVLLRFVLRDNRVAVAALFLVFTVIFVEFGQKTVWLDLAMGLLSSGIVVFVGLRYGFITMLSGLLFANLVEIFPWTTDLSAWFAPQTLLSWGILGAIMIYGFLTAIGGRPLFRDPLSDPAMGGRRPVKARL